MKLQHAVIVWLAIYTSQKLYRKPNMDGRYTDKLYLQTLYHMIDWSEGKWHPKAYRAQDVTFGLLKSITFIDESVHVTSNEMVKKAYFLNMNHSLKLISTNFGFLYKRMISHVFIIQ
ncbi:hypothetical protein LWI29_023890 [Acer saccharum]|uniref:Uncharacterized protein n=1 Tax=Acer saccharum TaxID=4024 RepID=A0AA39RE50_ACESA|nr:hypothetical protein LWI29_023890 [Acer saccharum]